MKKTSRIISFLVAFAMAYNGAYLVSSSASVVSAQDYDPNSESYKTIVEEYNDKEIALTELSELYSRALLPDGNVINVWESSESNTVMFCDVIVPDSFGVSINTPYIDAEEAEQLVVECVGVENTIVVNNAEPYSSSVYVEFNSNDHEQNHMKCIELKERFAEEYDLSSCKAFINAHYFYEAHISWNALLSSEPNFYNYSDSQTQDLNADLAEHGICAEYDRETQNIIFPDDITTRELLEYAVYIKETYGAVVSHNYLVTAKINGSIDLMAEDNIKLAGDANCDGNVNMSDAVVIMQFNSDPDTYALTEQGKLNADVIGGDGVTNNDALAIQQYEAGIISVLPIAE